MAAAADSMGANAVEHQRAATEKRTDGSAFNRNNFENIMDGNMLHKGKDTGAPARARRPSALQIRDLPTRCALAAGGCTRRRCP